MMRRGILATNVTSEGLQNSAERATSKQNMRRAFNIATNVNTRQTMQTTSNCISIKCRAKFAFSQQPSAISGRTKLIC